MKVKLKKEHPGQYVKVYAEDGSIFRITKRGIDVDEEYREELSKESALDVEGSSEKKSSSKKSKKSSKKKSSKSKKSSKKKSKKSSKKKSSKSKKSSKKDD